MKNLLNETTEYKDFADQIIKSINELSIREDVSDIPISAKETARDVIKKTLLSIIPKFEQLIIESLNTAMEEDADIDMEAVNQILELYFQALGFESTKEALKKRKEQPASEKIQTMEKLSKKIEPEEFNKIFSSLTLTPNLLSTLFTLSKKFSDFMTFMLEISADIKNSTPRGIDDVVIEKYMDKLLHSLEGFLDQYISVIADHVKNNLTTKAYKKLFPSAVDRMFDGLSKLESPDYNDPFQTMDIQPMGEVNIRTLDQSLKDVTGPLRLDCILNVLEKKKQYGLLRLNNDIPKKKAEVNELFKRFNANNETLKKLSPEVCKVNEKNVKEFNKKYLMALESLQDEEDTSTFIINNIDKDIHWIDAIKNVRELTVEDRLAATKYLFDATSFGCKNLTQFCIEYGANLNATDCMKRNVLFRACVGGRLNSNTCEIVTQLLDAGVSVNSKYPTILGIDMTLIMELLVNRSQLNRGKLDSVKAEDNIKICDDVINLLFSRRADIPKDLTEKGKNELESIITKESRMKRSFIEGKSFNVLYDMDKNSNRTIKNIEKIEEKQDMKLKESFYEKNKCIIS